MSNVKIWEENVIIPTYGVGERNPNPMFLEKQVYQGSTGRVYPHPVIDRIDDEKKDKRYTLVFLENEYIQVQVMPEIGGRIYRALDKTNQYDFVYYNRVIKPALIGLTGPWISGGIEFNWPQHHRPNTFGPVEYRLDDSKPDVKTVWMTELDRMYGTRVTTGISLRRGSALIKIHSELYNPTAEPQTFLWWANPAVAVHDETQSVFPPDVYAVMDHGKRDVSTFPIATGTYYKMDYSKGVDISRYRNIPVPTSYMAYQSDYDFVGGYDHRAKAGILHVADHHISPGKKQWTWGCGDFGKAWDRNLTDEDGPYIELMTGVFTDNQPDFTWLPPYEGKQFTQYFMPYREVSEVKNASKDLVIGMKTQNGKTRVSAYATRQVESARILLAAGEHVFWDTTCPLTPDMPYVSEVDTGNMPAQSLRLSVGGMGVQPLSYQPQEPLLEKLPDPAKAIGAPQSLANNKALWLAGIHLEQYRHATYEPEAYSLEGLKRDKADMRINNAYGNLLLRRAQFEAAQACFEQAEKTATRHSPNPFDGEAYYNLGKVYEHRGEEEKAFDAYYKATWSDAWKTQAFLKLGQISARQANWDQAVDFLYQSLYTGYKNIKTRGALVILLRRTGDVHKAISLADETLSFDAMDHVARYEKALHEGRSPALHDAHAAIALAMHYRKLGLWQESANILCGYTKAASAPYAMAYYYLADSLARLGDNSVWAQAAGADDRYCFPNSLEDYHVLRIAVQANPSDANAYYALGCFLYDKKRYAQARDMWEKSAGLNPGRAGTYRNLALYFANKENNYAKALTLLEKAVALDPADARIFYELCELYVKTGMSAAQLYPIMKLHASLVQSRDDLTMIYAQVLNSLGEHEKVIDLLTSRRFHPWEGGEGKVPTQHIEARIGLARRLIAEGRFQKAVSHLEKATIYYENFGEGKLAGAQKNNIHYYMGLALQKIDPKRSRACLAKAAQGLSEPASVMYYNDQPPHMIYYQGLALKALGQQDEAARRFNKLIAYGKKHIFEKQVMDYFAVSLPDFLVFETDLDEKSRVHCYYMMGLGYLGLGQKGEAIQAFDAGLALAPNHYGLQTHRKQADHKPD